MATQNATITYSWSLIANPSDDPILIQANRPGVRYQLATTETASAPTVEGHYLEGRQQGVTREVIGGGYIYGRLVGNSFGDDGLLIVSGSSETLS